MSFTTVAAPPPPGKGKRRSSPSTGATPSCQLAGLLHKLSTVKGFQLRIAALASVVPASNARTDSRRLMRWRDMDPGLIGDSGNMDFALRLKPWMLRWARILQRA